MPERQSMNRQADLARMLNPMQQFGETFLHSVERVADFQIEMMQAGTHFAVRQWQNALEIRDPWSLQEYFGKQRDAAEEFGRRVTEEMRVLAEAGQEITDQATRSARRETQFFSDLSERAVERGKAATERATEMAEKQTQRVQQAQQQSQQQQRQAASENGKLPIKNYDDLNVDDIENRLDSLQKDDIRKLLKYEQEHKNRKTLSEAFERRL